MARVLLITPPFTQLNTPYPATAYLKGFLNTKSIQSHQVDLGIEVILQLFSASGLKQLFDFVESEDLSEKSLIVYEQAEKYIETIEIVIGFLQSKDDYQSEEIIARTYLPEASRFEHVTDMEWMMQHMHPVDKAKHYATLYLEDLSDFIKENIDEHFGFSRYAERLGLSANSFDDLQAELHEDESFIDEITIALLDQILAEKNPQLVCFSVPFPGNLFSAFRCAQFIKDDYPHIKIAMGGGFPNTELRDLKDPRVFDYFDYISLDDGELPLELMIEDQGIPSLSKVIAGKGRILKRTFVREDGEVKYVNNSERKDYSITEVGTPDYSDLKLEDYISVIEMINPMHSLWTDGVWNKLTMAHGCYWAKCTFCDVNLDYIGRYEPAKAKTLVDRMEQLISQTGNSGFHFVDEAAPPALMKALAEEIIERGLQVEWWTNIRFEKSFTEELCILLADSGCIAVSGGLEVASDRLLKLINKGVTVEQVAKVTNYFTKAGIMVHAYLMYGYPSQTVQETIDSLEMVKQMFELGIIQSAFWHQFALTTHSPIGKDPFAYGIIPLKADITFANNDIQFADSTGIDHEQFSFGLKKSLYNYMHGLGFEVPVDDWFEEEVPKTTIGDEYIEMIIADSK